MAKTLKLESDYEVGQRKQRSMQLGMSYQGKDCCEPGGVDDVKTDMGGVLHSSKMLGERDLLWTQIKVYARLYNSDQIINTTL